MIKDSSIWVDPSSFKVVNRMDNAVRIGIIKKMVNDADSNELRWLVEIQDNGRKVNLNCRALRKFGGVYNYEDAGMRGYKYTDSPDPVANYNSKAGDTVLVALLNGQGREGIILGGIVHPARMPTLDSDEGPQYQSEFNGVETMINSDGEWILTFKGQPTNLDELDNIPSSPLPDPEYDMDVGSSFQKFDKQGGWTVSDNASEDPQSVVIDKAGGTLTITAGKVSLTLTKGSEDSTLATKTLVVNAETSIMATTKDYSMDASGTVKIKTPKIAIGSDSVELLEQLNQLITKLGAVQPISPLGPCTPLMATPQWSQVTQVQSKINEIKGTL